MVAVPDGRSDRVEARVHERLWPSCLAAVAVLASLLFMVQPALLAVAAPGAQAGAPANPVVVRISPAHNALGGGALAPGTPRYHLVRVHNDGGSRFRYELSVRTSGALAGIVMVEVRAVPGTCDAAAFASGVAVAGPAPMADVRGHGPAPLDAGQADTLCARVELPSDAVVPRGAGPTDAVLRVSAVQR